MMYYMRFFFAFMFIFFVSLFTLPEAVLNATAQLAKKEEWNK